MAEERGIGIPVIDVQKFGDKIEDEEEYKELREACEKWGCFRMVNHNIPMSLMSEMKTVVRSLLDLPMEIKIRNTDVVAGTGYIAPSQANPLYESLGLYDLASPQAVHAFCAQLDISPYQREIIEMYSGAAYKVAMDIGRRIAKSVGVDREYHDHLFEDWPCQLRINKYNFTCESLGSRGVQLHTDSGFLTILQDDENVGGLQVVDDKSGEFVAVDPWPGTLLVNLGDSAKAWSNGRFCNVKHRVQCKEASIRVSIAVFLMGPKEAPIEAPPELVDSKHPRLYIPFMYEDFLKLRLSTNMKAGEALQLVRSTTTVDL